MECRVLANTIHCPSGDTSASKSAPSLVKLCCFMGPAAAVLKGTRERLGSSPKRVNWVSALAVKAGSGGGGGVGACSTTGCGSGAFAHPAPSQAKLTAINTHDHRRARLLILAPRPLWLAIPHARNSGLRGRVFIGPRKPRVES